MNNLFKGHKEPKKMDVTIIIPIYKPERNLLEKAIKVLMAQDYPGKVKIIRNDKDLQKIKKGDILISTTTRPNYSLAMKKCGAIVTDEGGITSHAAILSREFGIPCIVGTQNATEYIRDGQKIIVDAQEGVIYSAEK